MEPGPFQPSCATGDEYLGDWQASHDYSSRSTPSPSFENFFPDSAFCFGSQLLSEDFPQNHLDGNVTFDVDQTTLSSSQFQDTLPDSTPCNKDETSASASIGYVQSSSDSSTSDLNRITGSSNRIRSTLAGNTFNVVVKNEPLSMSGSWCFVGSGGTMIQTNDCKARCRRKTCLNADEEDVTVCFENGRQKTRETVELNGEVDARKIVESIKRGSVQDDALVTQIKWNDRFTIRPRISYHMLATLALKNSRTGLMTSREIYNFVRVMFPYYQSAKTNWKSHLRTALSSSDDFITSTSNTGRGGFWTLNPRRKEMVECIISDQFEKSKEDVVFGLANQDEFEALWTGTLDRSHEALKPLFLPPKQLPGCRDANDITNDENDEATDSQSNCDKRPAFTMDDLHVILKRSSKWEEETTECQRSVSVQSPKQVLPESTSCSFNEEFEALQVLQFENASGISTDKSMHRPRRILPGDHMSDDLERISSRTSSSSTPLREFNTMFE